MDRDRIIDWLQIGGNLAILVGLLFVGFQLYQDRELKRAELIFATFETNQNRAFALLGEEPYRAIVKAAYKPDELSEEDAYVVSLALETWLRSFDRAAVMERLGVMESGWREGRRLGLAIEFGTEVGHRYLRETLPNWSMPEEVKETLVAQMNSPSNLRENIELWRGNVGNSE